MRRLLVALWLAWQAAIGHAYIRVWHSDLTLWTYAAAHAPTSERAYENRAKALYATGRYSEALR